MVRPAITVCVMVIAGLVLTLRGAGRFPGFGWPGWCASTLRLRCARRLPRTASENRSASRGTSGQQGAAQQASAIHRRGRGHVFVIGSSLPPTEPERPSAR